MNPLNNISPGSTLYRNLIHKSEYEDNNFYFQSAKSFLNIKEYNSALNSVDAGLTKDQDNISLLVLKAKILIYSNHNSLATETKNKLEEAFRIFSICEIMFKNKCAKLLKVKDTSLISRNDFLNYFNDKIKLDGLNEILKIYTKQFEVKKKLP